MRHSFTPIDQTINGNCMQCNILLNQDNSIPKTAFTNNNKNENSLIVVTKINPIASRPCVHSGTKFKVLSAYFIEIKQQSESFPLLTIIKTNKTKHSLVYW